MSTKFFRSLCSSFYVALVPECHLVQFVHEAKSMQKIAPADDCLLITVLTTFLNDKIFFLNYFILFTIRFISVFKTKKRYDICILIAGRWQILLLLLPSTSL